MRGTLAGGAARCGGAAHGRGRSPPWLSLHLAAEVLTALTVVHAEGRAHGALDADVVRGRIAAT
ncbi:MAG: hypothetical protein IPI43_30000 [Sandaracinaceae bacterium]|nr:hypothetical protein [Sandaracinaceae bacterium]